MTPTFESLQQLAAQLPPLDFSRRTDQRDWLATQAVQNYLQFYHIDFVAEGVAAQHHFGKFAAAGFEIAAHIWQPSASRGTVFFIHGFTDSVGLMQHAIRFLLQQQWTVVAFDLPGHGLSSGERAIIDSFDQYRDVLTTCLDHCENYLPKPWHGIGQSTGGAVWLNYLGSYPEQTIVDKVVLIAPLIRPTGWGYTQWVFPVVRRFTQELTRKYNASSHDEEFLRFVRHEDPLQIRVTPLRWVAAMKEWVWKFRGFPVQERELLVVQGDADLTVDWGFNLSVIKAKFPNARVVMVEGGGHQLVNEVEAYRQPMLEHMKAWLARN